MKNIEHIKSTVLGVLLLIGATIYKFAPIFWAQELSLYGSTWEPSTTVTIIQYATAIGLIVLYPEPFTSLFRSSIKYFLNK